jgi:segregation and condensation protein B
MSKPVSPTPPAAPADAAPLSAGRFAAAFAKLLAGAKAAQPAAPLEHAAAVEVEGPPAELGALSPSTVFEGLLFVGHPQGEPVTLEQCGAVLRGMSNVDFEELADRLNELYRGQQRPYHIERRADGFCLVLAPAFERLRDRLQSRTRRARLSRAALEVLSLVAYQGPVTADEIVDHCGGPAAAVLRPLVRRNLLAVERSAGPRGARTYRTTERFLEIFGLASLSELPRSQDLESTQDGS